VNTLVLWTVPVATVFGGAFLLLFFVGDFLSRILAFFVYIPLGIFANAIELFSKVSFAQVEFQFSLVGICRLLSGCFVYEGSAVSFC